MRKPIDWAVAERLAARWHAGTPLRVLIEETGLSRGRLREWIALADRDARLGRRRCPCCGGSGISPLAETRESAETPAEGPA